MRRDSQRNTDLDLCDRLCGGFSGPGPGPGQQGEALPGRTRLLNKAEVSDESVLEEAIVCERLFERSSQLNGKLCQSILRGIRNWDASTQS